MLRGFGKRVPSSFPLLLNAHKTTKTNFLLPLFFHTDTFIVQWQEYNTLHTYWSMQTRPWEIKETQNFCLYVSYPNWWVFYSKGSLEHTIIHRDNERQRHRKCLLCITAFAQCLGLTVISQKNWYLSMLTTRSLCIGF